MSVRWEGRWGAMTRGGGRGERGGGNGEEESGRRNHLFNVCQFVDHHAFHEPEGKPLACFGVL